MPERGGGFSPGGQVGQWGWGGAVEERDFLYLFVSSGREEWLSVARGSAYVGVWAGR